MIITREFFKKMFLVPPNIAIFGGGGYCYPESIDTRKCFLLCRHVSSSSSRLFNILLLSSVRITSFSVKHRSQALDPLENVCPFAFIDHLISKGVSFSFRSQIKLDNVVWFAGLLLIDDLCAEYLLLKSAVDPKYLIMVLLACTSAWYTTFFW